MVRSRPGWLTGGALAGVTVVLLGSLLWIGGRDDPAPEDAELLPRRSVVAPAVNSFELLVRAAEVSGLSGDFVESIASLREGDWDQPRVDALLAVSAAPLELLDVALARAELHFPPVEDLRQEFPYLRSWRILADILELRARWLFRAGLDGEAVDEAFKILRLGSRIQAGEGSLVHFLTGRAIKQRAVAFLLDLVSQLRLPAENWVSQGRDLEASGDDLVGLSFAVKSEYELLRQLIWKLDQGEASWEQVGLPEAGSLVELPHLFLPNRTLALFAETYRTFLQSASLPCAELDPLEVEDSVGGPWEDWLFWLRPNAMGLRFYRIGVPGLENILVGKCRYDLQLARLRILWGLRCYHENRGEWPTELAELVPSCLDSVPNNPWDGGHFLYDAKEVRLSSGVLPPAEDHSGVADFAFSHPL